MLVYATAKVLSHILDHFRLENVVNLMLYLYASWAFRHVALQQHNFANYPEVIALQKNPIASDKNLLGCFLIVKS